MFTTTQTSLIGRGGLFLAHLLTDAEEDLLVRNALQLHTVAELLFHMYIEGAHIISAVMPTSEY